MKTKLLQTGILPTLILCFANLADGKPVKISSVSNLQFPVAVQGDGVYTIPAGTSETLSNASFSVTGDPNVSFSIVLPTSATLNYKRGPTTDSIPLGSFTSFPANVGLLSGAGTSSLYVGATRGSIRSDQIPGSYSGSFSVTVVY